MISLNSIKLLVVCLYVYVYRAVQTESLSAGHVNCRLSESGDLPLASHRGECVRSQVSPREIFGGQSSSVSGFSSRISVFSCDYHSTNAPCSPSSTQCSYQQERWMKSGNLPKNNALLQVRNNGWKSTSIFLFFFFRFQRVAFWHSFTMNHIM